MIKLDDIRKIVKLVLISGYLKNHKPLSLLVVGKAGNGKTETIQSFKTKRAVVTTDLSYRGVLNMLEKDPLIKHIIVPDFLKITMKKRATSDNLVSLLNALTEEGVGKIEMYNYSVDLKGRQAGIIIATTKESYDQHKRTWEGIGFVSRMIVCSYDYSDESIEEIINYINKEIYLKEHSLEKLANYRDKSITSTKEMNEQLNKFVSKRFRTLKQLQTLAKCHALCRGSDKVEQVDIDEISRLAQYLNLRYTKI